MDAPGSRMSGSDGTAGTGKPRLLFLDDEERILNSLRAIFRFKYDVFTAASGEDALNILRHYDIAVVVSDQRMPYMTGIEFLRQAKEVAPHAVRILLTGFSDLQAVIDSVNDGEVFRFINKPWSNREILAVIEEAVSVHGDVSRSMPLAGEALAASGAAAKEKDNVLVKCADRNLYETIRQAVPPSIELLHATDQRAALDVLQSRPVSVMVTMLDETPAEGEDEFDFLKLLKRELPGLMTVSIVKSADYDNLISLINEAKVYRYVVLPAKPGRIVHFIESALQQACLVQKNPALLRQQSVERTKPLKEAYDDKSGTLMAKIGSIRKMFGRL